jgi:hypothetical protein
MQPTQYPKFLTICGVTVNRNGAAAVRRPATANASTAVYPNGFLPEIHSEIRRICSRRFTR